MSKSTTKIKVHLRGVTPLLQNRDDVLVLDPSLGKNKNESYEERENRIWAKKAHFNDKGQVIFPNTWMRKSLIASQGMNASPIRPANSRKATDTMKPYFISAILVDDSLITLNGVPVVEGTLVPFKKMVSPQGKGKVLCIRPMIPAGWEVETEIITCDSMIRPEHIYDSLEWAGQFNGAGDWRAQKGGLFGRFEVVR